MLEIVLPPNSHVKALIPNVTIFGDMAFKEVIKIKYGHMGRDLIIQDWCPDQEEVFRELCVHRVGPCEDNVRRVGIHKPEREASPETDPDVIF